MKLDEITKCQPLMWGMAIAFWVILAVIVLLGYAERKAHGFSRGMMKNVAN